MIGQAISSVSMRKAGKVEYVLQLRPLYVEPARIHHCVGAIVNIDDQHWVALKAVSCGFRGACRKEARGAQHALRPNPLGIWENMAP